MLDLENMNTAGRKRRACDECRTRKLACSKEKDGCLRCAQEKVACHYSNQKQMGRPRKLPQNENSQSVDQSVSKKWTGHHSADSHIATGSHNVFPTMDSGFDQSIHFLEDPDQIAERARWNFGESIGFANMDDTGPQTAMSVETSSSNSWSAHSLTQEKVDISSPKPPFPNSLACTCIDIIYLAMSSLREISADISFSIQTVRSALYSTQSVLRCPHCGIVVLTELEPPLAAFQNAMLLGTLLTTVIEAYKKLLAIVDVEANRAKAAGSSKVFRLSEYGGNLASYEVCCERTAMYENIEMDPDEWRTTVRALLRTDIYGQPGTTGGLAALMKEVDERQRNRTAQLDFLRERSMTDAERASYTRDPDGYCVKILQHAKDTFESLVIA